MKFLLVEDDIKIASFLKKWLEEEYYYVDVSHDGEEAIYLASVNEYDLIILDIMLPSKDGYEVCKHLRANKISTPIITREGGFVDIYSLPYLLNRVSIRYEC